MDVLTFKALDMSAFHSAQGVRLPEIKSGEDTIMKKEKMFLRRRRRLLIKFLGPLESLRYAERV